MLGGARRFLRRRCIIYSHGGRAIFNSAPTEKDTKIEDGQVPNLLEESWYVTPPPCFEGSGGRVAARLLETNPMEDLLIEHPSMSVYGPRTRRQASLTSSPSRSASAAAANSDGNDCVARRQPRRTVNYQTQLELIQKRRQTEVPITKQPRPNRKKLKRQNHVHSQAKRSKKKDRMLGKHVGMHGKRGS